MDAKMDSNSMSSNENSVKDLEAATNAPQPPASSPPSADIEDQFLVKWDPDEKANPFNYSSGYKAWVTFQLGMLALAASLGSSIISPAGPAISQEFGVSEEVAVLNVSLYVLGFAVGPSLWAPISEVWGRRVSMLPAMTCLALFSIGCAVSQNAATVFICRFFSGVFACAPVSNVSAALGDYYTPDVRGNAVALYAVAVVGGPTLGPIIGSAIVVNPHMGWRWTEYILAIWVFAIVVLSFFCLPEVYGPYLLKRKAQKKRKETGDNRWYHPHESVKIDPKSIVTKHFSRPILMLTTEPMVASIAVYASFVYALLYMTLEVFPIVFEQMRGWSPVVGSLPFLGLFVGVLFSTLMNLANQRRYARLVKENDGKPVPEGRLLPMAVGAFLFAIGLWWFG